MRGSSHVHGYGVTPASRRTATACSYVVAPVNVTLANRTKVPGGTWLRGDGALIGVGDGGGPGMMLWSAGDGVTLGVVEGVSGRAMEAVGAAPPRVA